MLFFNAVFYTFYAECHIFLLLNVVFAECHYDECPNSECHYAECRGAPISNNLRFEILG